MAVYVAMTQNGKLKTVLAALRTCGNTTVPMGLAIRMAETQKNIVTRIEYMIGINNDLIKKFGEPNGAGDHHVSPEMPGWKDYVKSNRELEELEFELGEAFVLYQKDDKFGWTPEVKTPIAVTPNTMVDMGSLLVIQAPKDPVAGHIEPADEVE